MRTGTASSSAAAPLRSQSDLTYSTEQSQDRILGRPVWAFLQKGPPSYPFRTDR